MLRCPSRRVARHHGARRHARGSRAPDSTRSGRRSRTRCRKRYQAAGTCTRARLVKDAVDVKCTDDELIVTLVDGRRVSAPLAWFPRLLRATPKQRANWRLIGRGIGIHWEDVDEDISVRSLLAS